MKNQLTFFTKKHILGLCLVIVLSAAQNNFCMEGQQENKIPTLFDLSFESAWNYDGNFFRGLLGHGAISQIKHNNKISALDANNQFIITGSQDGVIMISDLATGKCINTFDGHMGEISALAISPNGQFIVSGSLDKIVKIWDMESGTCLQSLEKTGCVRSIAISKNNKRIAIGTRKKAKLLKSKTLNCLDSVKIVRKKESCSDCGDSRESLRTFKTIKKVAINDNNRLCYVVAGCAYREIVTTTHWRSDSRDGEASTEGSYDTTSTKMQYFLEIYRMTFKSQQLKKSKKKLREKECRYENNHFDNYNFGDLNIDHGIILTTGCDFRAYIRNFENKKKIKIPGFFKNTGKLCSTALSTDGTFVVTGHTDQAIVSDAQSGRCLCRLLDQDFQQISISPSGKFIIGLDENGTAHIWKINVSILPEKLTELLSKKQKRCLIS